jgi:hypothetical protein
MDAATLYIVLTLPNGGQSTVTQGFTSMQACEAHVDFLREVERADLDPDFLVKSYRCEEHERIFTYFPPYERGRPRRDDFGPHLNGPAKPTSG